MPFENQTSSGYLQPNLSERYALALIAASRPSPASRLPARTVCRIVSRMTGEMATLLMERVNERRDKRRPACHVRQIAMYVCHVALRMSFRDIGLSFGRHRTTVGHSCQVVEDRRDDAAFDEFVTAIERMATTVFQYTDLSAYEATEQDLAETFPEVAP